MLIIVWLVAVLIIWAVIRGGTGPRITGLLILLAATAGYGAYVRPVRPKLSRELDRRHIERIVDSHGLDNVTVVGLRPDTWFPKAEYKKGEFVNYAQAVYFCIQGHTSRAGWEPPNVKALWALYRTPDEPIGDIPAWRQPFGDGDLIFNRGDRVRHNGQVWESTIDDNVWEPGVYGWVVAP